MITPIDEAFARLSMLEFALEVMFANKLASDPMQSSQKFKDDFVRLMRAGKLPDKFNTYRDEVKEAEISQRAIQMAEHFIQKVTVRETLIRDVIRDGGCNG